MSDSNETSYLVGSQLVRSTDQTPDDSDAIYAEDADADALAAAQVHSESLGEMCVKVVELLGEQARLEAALEESKKMLKLYTEKLIPSVMQSMSLQKMETEGGLVIEVKNEVRASLPKDERREKAFEYLRGVGSQGLIRTEFAIGFGVGTDADAQRLADLLSETGLDQVADVKAERTINHSQMLKFLREQLRAGAAVPMDAFGAFVQTFATVKLSR